MGQEEDDEDQTCVWGTDIHVPTLCRRLRRFLKHYEDAGATEPKYMALLRQVRHFQYSIAWLYSYVSIDSPTKYKIDP